MLAELGRFLSCASLENAQRKAFSGKSFARNAGPRARKWAKWRPGTRNGKLLGRVDDRAKGPRETIAHPPGGAALLFEKSSPLFPFTASKKNFTVRPLGSRAHFCVYFSCAG